MVPHPRGAARCHIAHRAAYGSIGAGMETPTTADAVRERYLPVQAEPRQVEHLDWEGCKAFVTNTAAPFVLSDLAAAEEEGTITTGLEGSRMGLLQEVHCGDGATQHIHCPGAQEKTDHWAQGSI